MVLLFVKLIVISLMSEGTNEMLPLLGRDTRGLLEPNSIFLSTDVTVLIESLLVQQLNFSRN